MAFNQTAFVHYKAETQKKDDLFPIAVDNTGKVFNYKDETAERIKNDAYRAFGEDNIEVNEPQ